MDAERRRANIDPIAFFHELESLRTDEPALAEPMIRFIARTIDFVIMGVILLVVTFGMFALVADPMPDNLSPAEQLTYYRDESWLAFLAGLSSVALLILVTELDSRGRTIGKRIMGVYVAPADGYGVLPFATRVKRLLAFGIPVYGSILAILLTGGQPGGFLVLFGGIGLVIAVPGQAFFDNDKRGLHDRLAGTRVVTPRT